MQVKLMYKEAFWLWRMPVNSSATYFLFTLQDYFKIPEQPPYSFAVFNQTSPVTKTSSWIRCHDIQSIPSINNSDVYGCTSHF